MPSLIIASNSIPAFTTAVYFMLQGIIKRDEMVFGIVRDKRIPIVMLTSGGYQRRTAEIIARSILNLRDKRLIENSPSTQWHVPAAHGGSKNNNNSY